MRFARRATIVVVLIAACAAAALVSGVVTGAGSANASASGSCQLGTKAGDVKHVIYLQFDNTHFKRDVAGVPSDLEQMPHLLNFLKGERHAPLERPHDPDLAHRGRDPVVAHRALPGPHRTGRLELATATTRRHGIPAFSSSFKYWTDVTSATADPLPNMVSDGGQTAPEPWLTYTAAGCNVGGVSAANIELENNTSIAITSLSAASLVSDTTIKVGSVAAMAPGQVLTIDTGAATRDRDDRERRHGRRDRNRCHADRTD